MTSALGINQTWLFTSVLFVGSLLAGLGGALQIPREAVNLQMDINIVVEAFVVVVVGGMGSVGGAFLAAVLIGQLQAFGILIFPQITLVIVFLFMAVVLVVRPHGLLGRPQALARGPVTRSRRCGRPLRWDGWRVWLCWLWRCFRRGRRYALAVLTEILILTLFAASLHFIMGPGGMVSFGHAAYFGLGAYGAGLLVKHFAAGMLPGLAAAPLLAGGARCCSAGSACGCRASTSPC